MESKLMTTSKTTTGEIISALHSRSDCEALMDAWNENYRVCNIAADCLESQEQTIEQLNTELAGNVEEFAELTARAEQAERERDAAVAEFDVIAQDGLCEVCFFGDFSEVSKDTCMEDCCFQWRNKKRGLAQEGKGLK